MIYIYIYISIHLYMYIYIYIYIHYYIIVCMYTHIHIYIHMYVCMYVCMYVRMYVCMYVYIYIYIYIYLFIYYLQAPSALDDIFPVQCVFAVAAWWIYIHIYMCVYIYIYIQWIYTIIYTHVYMNNYIYIYIYISRYMFDNPRQEVVPRSRIPRSTSHFSYSAQEGVPLRPFSYGQFSKFHVCFCGPDPGNLKLETVRTHKQHICF